MLRLNIIVICLILLTTPACTAGKAAPRGNKGPTKVASAAPGAATPPRRHQTSTGKQSPTHTKATPKPTKAVVHNHHAVFSFAANRALGHLIRQEGFALAGGLPGIAKYLKFKRPWRTWALNRKVEGVRCAVANRSTSWLVIPLTEAQAKSKVLRVRLATAVKQRVGITINGKKLGRVKLSVGWQEVSLPIDNKVLKAGENTIGFVWNGTKRIGGVRRSHGALDWLHLSLSETKVSAAFEPTQGPHLYLPRGGGLSYYVMPRRGSSLWVRASKTAGCTLTLRAQATGAKEPKNGLITRLLPHIVQGQLLNLDFLRGEAARIELLAHGPQCKGLVLQEAAIVRPGPKATVQRAKRPKNILFWMVDNWRADHFRSYNPKSRVETPVMSELARTGTVFDAYVAGNESRVSHANVWTGMFPKQHRFISAKSKLRSGFQTLAEVLKRAGLYTAAWTANGNISKFWGFGEGWRFFRNTLHKGGGITADRLANHAVSFIKERGNKPFYLYIGTIDPHVSWHAREPWLKRYYPEPYRGPFRRRVAGTSWDKLAARPMSLKASDRKRVLAIYDSTISFNDHHLGRVLAALQEKGVRDDTMIVVTADHGEEFWEYGRIGHGSSMRDEVVRVPLLIHYPPLFGRGVRVDEGVNVASIMASVLDAVGAPIPDTVQAQSLLPLAQGVGRGYPLARFASQYELAHSMRIGPYKIWVGAKGIPRLFDMRVTHKPERRNWAAKLPIPTRMLTDALSTFLVYQNRWRQARWGVANNQRAALATDLLSDNPPAIIRAY